MYSRKGLSGTAYCNVDYLMKKKLIKMVGLGTYCDNWDCKIYQQIQRILRPTVSKSTTNTGTNIFYDEKEGEGARPTAMNKPIGDIGCIPEDQSLSHKDLQNANIGSPYS